jgi:hypothetical protein
MNIAVLEALAEAGASVEIILAAVRAQCAEAEAKQAIKKAKDAERQRRKREKDDQKVTHSHEESRGQTVTSRDPSSLPSPPKKVSPITPSKNNPPIPSSTHAALTRAPVEVDLFENKPDKPKAPDAEVYRVGRELLGKGAGGVVTKLIAAKGGNLNLAHAALLQASAKDRPREYIGAIIREKISPDDVDRHVDGRL